MFDPGEQFDPHTLEQVAEFIDEYEEEMSHPENNDGNVNGKTHANHAVSDAAKRLIKHKHVTSKKVLKCLVALSTDKWDEVERFVALTGAPVQQSTLIEYLQYMGKDADPKVAAILDRVVRGHHDIAAFLGEIEVRDQQLAEDL